MCSLLFKPKEIFIAAITLLKELASSQLKISLRIGTVILKLISIRQRFCALACALLVSGCATKSLEWQQRTEDEFPTRVNWIISQVGNVLDAKRELRYGTWTVTSGKGGPLATYQCPQDGICEINISNLQCQQSAGGPSSCELVLYKNAICELVIPEKKETLEIGCPIHVALKPKGEGETASPKEAAATAAAAPQPPQPRREPKRLPA